MTAAAAVQDLRAAVITTKQRAQLQQMRTVIQTLSRLTKYMSLQHSQQGSGLGAQHLGQHPV
jgi:hypothetical protein